MFSPLSPVDLLFGKPEQQGQQKPSDPLGVLYFLCGVHSRCITVFIRAGFGVEGLGIPAIFSLALLIVCLGGDPYMLVWLGAWILAVIVQRIITFRLLAKGHVMHSRYEGTPLLLKIPFLRKEKFIKGLEALLCLAVGLPLIALSPFVGVFLALGFVTILVQAAIDDTLQRRRIQKMQDARIEAHWYRDGMN